MATEGGAETRLDGTIVLGLAANCGQVRQVVHVVAIDVTLPTTWRGPVDRLPLMWVECAVCVGCVELLGWPLVLRDGSV